VDKIKQLEHLVELDIADTQVSQDCIYDLSHMPNLEKLTVSQDMVDVHTISTIENEKPVLKLTVVGTRPGK
jgi:hypothetical protein